MLKPLCEQSVSVVRGDDHDEATRAGAAAGSERLRTRVGILVRDDTSLRHRCRRHKLVSFRTWIATSMLHCARGCRHAGAPVLGTRRTPLARP